MGEMLAWRDIFNAESQSFRIQDEGVCKPSQVLHALVRIWRSTVKQARSQQTARVGEENTKNAPLASAARQTYFPT